jgi:hypothetical protein
LDLKTSGSKADRMHRVVEHFENASTDSLRASSPPPVQAGAPTGDALE